MAQLPFKLAVTFMRRRGSKMPGFTAIVSVLGVAVGVAAFLVVVTIFNSFETQLKQILMAANPHLVVFKLPQGIPYAETYKKELAKQIDRPVSRLALFEYSEVILTKGQRTAAVVLRGLEGMASASAEDLEKAIAPPNALSKLNNEFSSHQLAWKKMAESNAGRTELENSSVVTLEDVPKLDLGKPPGVILGRGLSLKLQANVGDEVTFVVNPYGTGTKTTLQRFIVVGTLSVGLAQYDEKLALVNFFDAAHLFGKPGWAKGIEIKFKNSADALGVSTRISPNIPYTARAWEQINHDLFAQIERDGSAIKIIVLIITLVAGFNIIVTLSLSVLDRTKQISLLRSLGAGRWFVVSVFVFMGAILGFVGALVGVLIGLGILWVFSGLELGDLQAFYFLERIPVYYDYKLILLSFSVAFLLSFVSALYPAWKATLVSPIHGLKPGQG